MLRLTVLLTGVALVAPAGAIAAPFGELPFRPVSGTATCLRATGAPGEFVRDAGTHAQILRAGAAGLERVADLPTERRAGCPQAAARPGGAGVLGFLERAEAGGGTVVRAYVRDPGGDWGSPAEVLRPAGDSFDSSVAVAVSGRGDALVAAGSPSTSSRVSIVVARRAPGGTFGASVTLSSARSEAFTAPTVRAGMSAAGEAVVAWAIPTSHELWAAVAAPGAAFGAPKRVGELTPGLPFDLAVAADGRALLAFGAGGALQLAERAPGGGFAAAAPVADAVDRLGVLPAVALRADGGAVVGWYRFVGGDVHALVRDRPGAFGAPVALGAAEPLLPAGLDPFFLAFATLFSALGGDIGQSGASPDNAAGDLRATIAADGRALLTWAGPRRRDGVLWKAPGAAALPLTGGGHVDVQALGAELRDAGSVTPASLADGTPAIAWTDNGARDRDGRLHLAAEGAVAAVDPPAPQVRTGAPIRRRLRAAAALVLPVTCSAACDVRAQVEGHADALGTLSLRRAGSGRLTLEPTLRPIATLTGGPVRVRLRYGAPGAGRASARALTLRLRRLPSPPLPRVLGARATRDGDDVVVTWRTDRPVKGRQFIVSGAATRPADADLLTIGNLFGEDGDRLRTRFSVRLDDARGVRWATIVVPGELATNIRRTTVRVR